MNKLGKTHEISVNARLAAMIRIKKPRLSGGVC